jgi:catalase
LLTPGALTPSRFVDGFEQTSGVHPGYRRNHAKGICVSGVFESNGNAARLSKAVVFKPGRVPVVGRLSLGGGDPHAADAPDAVRGLGLSFALPDGEEWRTAMINLPVFPVRTPQGFYDRMIAMQPNPHTSQPDPAKVSAFLARHPETVRAVQIIKGAAPSAGFGDSTFNGLNAFRFIDFAGVSTPVRWSLVPLQPVRPVDAQAPKRDDPSYLFDTLAAELRRGPLQWQLVILVGKPDDPTNDASQPWPDDRERITAGVLTLDHADTAGAGACRDLNFDPLVLPTGIEPSDDPLLSARSAVYSQSFTRRAAGK